MNQNIYYRVKKELPRADVGSILIHKKDFGTIGECLTLKRDGMESVVVFRQLFADVVRDGFIEPIDLSDLRWKARNNEKWFYIDGLGNVRSNASNASNRGKKLHASGNMFRSENTANAVSDAYALFLKYLHTVPGTPQQNVKNEFEAAHAKARKLVIADDEGGDCE